MAATPHAVPEAELTPELTPELAVLAERFALLFPVLEPAEAAVALALYRLLGRGRPVSWSALGEATGRAVPDLQARVRPWPGVFEQDGTLTGFGGLSVRAVSSHRLIAGPRELYARCAWDALFLPAVLGVPLEVHSACAVSGTPVRLRVAPGALQALDPPALRLSMLEPQAAMRDDLTRHF
jgi:alkylmercury lyase